VPPRVVLVGPPGSGKSAVGRRLAERLGLPFRDTDADIEGEQGRSIADIFVDDGEAAFRVMESAAVAIALAEHGGVLALGGGAVLDPRTRLLLRGLPVVYLEVSIADAARRIGLNRDRPLLVGNPRGQWIRLMDERRGLYEEVATVTVSTDGATADEAAERVLAALGAGAPR
jgi:shikimate kinase